MSGMVNISAGAIAVLAVIAWLSGIAVILYYYRDCEDGEIMKAFSPFWPLMLLASPFVFIPQAMYRALKFCTVKIYKFLVRKRSK